MSEYIDEIYNMMIESYKPIGGFLTANSPQELQNKCDLIKFVKRNNKITAVSCYKLTKFGRKPICKATEITEQGKSTEQGKKDLYSIIEEDIKKIDRKVYSEVSGKLEEIYLKKGAIKIPNYLVSLIIDKEIELDNDGFHYFRTIKGQKIRKLLVGNYNN
jgi:hypothetical protein